jgi:hypothetical protein
MSYCVLCVCLRILMSSSSTLPPVVCRSALVLLCFVCMFTYIDVEMEIKNGQSREIGNSKHIRHRTKTKQNKKQNIEN